MQILYIFYDIRQPAGYGKTAIIGNAAVKYIKIGLLFIESVQKISVPHCQLIKVCQQG